MKRGKLELSDVPESIRDNLEKALEKKGVSWDSLTESQKKQLIGGGKKAHSLYNEYS